MQSHSNLKLLMEEFNRSAVAGIITNTAGFILELNHAAARFFDSEVEKLKYKKFRMFFADRKQSIERYEETRVKMEVLDSMETKGLLVRTQPIHGKRRTIRANITSKVLGRGNRIVLICWNLVDADFATSTLNENILQDAIS